MSSRILLAEDNERLASMLKSFLESLGHQVTWAADGDAALDALQGEPVQLAILDLKLPGTSGIEVLQKIRKSPQLKKLAVMIITGAYRGEGYARAAEKLGVKAYLEKPFGKEAFVEAVAAALAPPPQARQFADLLSELHGSRQSGTLELPCGCQVTFLNGEPASFRSSQFVKFLVSSGQLASPDIEGYPHDESARLHLTQAGLLSYDELVDQSRLFLCQRLSEALEHDHEATFVPELGEVELPLTPLSMPRLLHQVSRGSSRRFDVETFLKRYGSLYPAKTRQYYRLANLVTMGREEIELIDRFGKGATLATLVSSCSDPALAASFLQFLIRMRMVSLQSAPVPDEAADFPLKRLFNRPIEEVSETDVEAISFEDLVDEVSDSVELMVGEEGMAAPLSPSEIKFEQEVQRDYVALQEKNYYEIFSLTQASFSFQSLKDAYFKKTRHYSPEKFMQLSGATLARAQDVLSHYANAYNTLSNVVAKERYDEMLKVSKPGEGGKEDDQLQARIQFQSGQVFMEMQDYPHAERALQEAYTLDPNDPLTCAYLAWSIYKNPANDGSKAAQDKCRMLLSKSLQNGKCAEAFAFRGWILMDEGRDGLAEGEFQKALKLNPRERTALTGMRLISERREAEKKGLFKRIFG